MSRGRNSSPGLPSWYKGRKVLDDISAETLYERRGDVIRQRNLNVGKRSFDQLTDQERLDQLNRSR